MKLRNATGRSATIYFNLMELRDLENALIECIDSLSSCETEDAIYLFKSSNEILEKISLTIKSCELFQRTRKITIKS